jgi:hypothetical protein
MGAYFGEFCGDCQRCTKSKVTTKVHTQVLPSEMLGLSSMLPVVSGGFSHLFTMVTGAQGGRKLLPSPALQLRHVRMRFSLSGEPFWNTLSPHF